MRTIEHWIGGTATAGDSTRTGPVWDPATGEQQAAVLLAEPSDVDRAVGVAAAAGREWADASISRRTRVLFAFRELVHARAADLAEIVAAEHGKVLPDAMGEVQRGLEVVEYACGIPTLLRGGYSDQVSDGVDTYSLRQPLGVVAGITPFNFPVMVPMWLHPIAIACGNAFVLKPSERDPSASNAVAGLWAEAGLPEGVFNVVHGDGVAVDAILDHPGVAAVSFVGSTVVARHVHRRATAAGKRVQALGGAKNHAVVLPGADLDLAAEQVSAAAFGSAGERCMAISATVAVGGEADRLVARIDARARAVRVGPAQDPASEMGPVITPEARQRIVGLIDSGERDGATVTVDGRGLVVPGCEGGFFVGPTVLDGVRPDMEVYATEVFGPVLSVLRAATVEEAVALVNANPYGNGTAVFTRSGGAARRFAREVQVGMVGVNVPVPVPAAFYSFGGWKGSLFGEHHVHGPDGIAFYTRGKVVTARWPGDDGGAAGDVSLDMPTGR